MRTGDSVVQLAAAMTVAWLSNAHSRHSANDVPAFFIQMHAALGDLAGVTTGPADQTQNYIPAVSVRKSLASRDHLISMIDGKPYKTLRRHLASHGLSPEEYRDRYNLKSDYPMVAPTYSESRSALAKKTGLGRRSNKGARAGKAAALATPPPVGSPDAPRS